ncbi:ectonucleotide pyrophosphatase/phosphodiesterase [Idiomarina seosinensis]|uniref:alkaline phosphatase family protein n=1 Tax=Idiomarina seosinensis TaxID=281739 RepID=UPI00384E76FA
MRLIIWVSLALLSVILPAKAAEQTVVLISIDGFRHDYIEKHDAKHIAEIAAQGVRADGLIPVYPAKTFPNHLSIVTGQYPANHGLVDNNFYDTERQQQYSMGDGVEDSSWLTTLPIWNLAEFQGVKAATFFWPESEARINGRTASYYYHYSTPTPNRQRVEQIIDWLKLPAAARPRLVTGYFSVVDHMGHRFGPDSRQVKGAVQHIDQLIGELWQRLQTEVEVPVNLILVSDHGMSEIKAAEMIEPDSLPIDDKLFKTVNSQTRFLIYPRQATSEAQIQQLRGTLDSMDNKAFYLETESQLEKLAVKPGPRKPAIILATDAPVTFATRPVAERSDGGTHGYHSSREMDGIFITAGPAINPQARLQRFSNIHIYPFMAQLLELDLLTEIDGDEDFLSPLLKAN